MPSSAPSISTNAANCETEPGKDSTYRIAGLNLLAAIIIYWNTQKLSEAVFARREEDLAHHAGPTSRRPARRTAAGCVATDAATTSGGSLVRLMEQAAGKDAVNGPCVHHG